MTKKAKKLFLRSVAALAALTVVSCGLLGSTFARYISTSEGDAVTGIAKWDVELDNKFPDTAAIMAVQNKLSPDVGTFDGTKDRVQSTGGALALTITNQGDVDANITVSGDSGLIYYKAYSDGAQTPFTDWGDTGFAVAEDGSITAPSKDEANAVIKMEFAYSTESNSVPTQDWKSLNEIATEINSQNNSTGIKLLAKSGDVEGGSFYFFVRATWTSQDKYFYAKNPDTAEKMSNLLDTWFGGKIVAVGQRVTFTALQSSELPTA